MYLSFALMEVFLWLKSQVNLKCFVEFADGDEWEAETFVAEQKQAEAAEDALQAQEKERAIESTALSSVRVEPTELPHHCECLWWNLIKATRHNGGQRFSALFMYQGLHRDFCRGALLCSPVVCMPDYFVLVKVKNGSTWSFPQWGKVDAITREFRT